MCGWSASATASVFKQAEVLKRLTPGFLSPTPFFIFLANADELWQTRGGGGHVSAAPRLLIGPDAHPL